MQRRAATPGCLKVIEPVYGHCADEKAAKEHEAKPMTVDDALYEMELVGHDFFLFHDKQSDKPTVVYRRHAYDYGLIRLA